MILKDYKYHINYMPNGYHDCENHGCDDEGICRCYTIESVDIKSIDIIGISNNIFYQLFDVGSVQYQRNSKLIKLLYGSISKEIDLYCIDRILRINKLYLSDKWNSEWIFNYYGEEVNEININDDVYEKITSDLYKLISLDTIKEKIEFLLIKEYGLLIDVVKDKNYKLITIDKSDVIFGQTKHKEKVDKKELDFYSDKNYDLIRGVCLKDDNKWRVIDGYHRLSKTKNDKIKIIGIC